MKYFNYLLVIFYLLPITSLHAQNVGVGTDAPVEFFSVGASSQFRVNASGNLVRINNVQYSFPAVQATSGSVLANDGSGNLSWTKVTTGNISATGTANNTTFLRGDGAWASAGGGSFPQVVTTQTFSGAVTNNINLTSYSISNSGYYLITANAAIGGGMVGQADIVQIRILEGATTKAESHEVIDTSGFVVSISSVVYLTAGTTLFLNFSIGGNLLVTNGQMTVTRLQ